MPMMLKTGKLCYRVFLVNHSIICDVAKINFSKATIKAISSTGVTYKIPFSEGNLMHRTNYTAPLLTGGNLPLLSSHYIEEEPNLLWLFEGDWVTWQERNPNDMMACDIHYVGEIVNVSGKLRIQVMYTTSEKSGLLYRDLHDTAVMDNKRIKLVTSRYWALNIEDLFPGKN